MNSQDSANKFPFNDTSIQVKTDKVKIRSNNCINIFANAGTTTEVRSQFPISQWKTVFYKALLFTNVRHEQITHQRLTVSL